MRSSTAGESGVRSERSKSERSASYRSTSARISLGGDCTSSARLLACPSARPSRRSPPLSDAANPRRVKVRESRTTKTKDFTSGLCLIGQGLYIICGKTLALSCRLPPYPPHQQHSGLTIHL